MNVIEKKIKKYGMKKKFCSIKIKKKSINFLDISSGNLRVQVRLYFILLKLQERDKNINYKLLRAKTVRILRLGDEGQSRLFFFKIYSKAFLGQNIAQSLDYDIVQRLKHSLFKFQKFTLA